MRKIITILAAVFCIALHAVEYSPIIPRTQAPTINMQPVNNTAFMSSGSTYSPAVYEVGAYSPSATYKPAAGVRKAIPGKDDSGYDPNNPQFAPLTDALIPLFLFALGYLMYILYRKRQEKKRNIRIT